MDVKAANPETTLVRQVATKAAPVVLQIGMSAGAAFVGERVHRAVLIRGGAVPVLTGLAAAAGAKALFSATVHVIDNVRQDKDTFDGVALAALDGARTGAIDGILGIKAAGVHRSMIKTMPKVGRIGVVAVTGGTLGAFAGGADAATRGTTWKAENPLLVIGKSAAIGTAGGAVLGAATGAVGLYVVPRFVKLKPSPYGSDARTTTEPYVAAKGNLITLPKGDEVYTNAKILMDREISPAVQGQLQGRWQTIAQDASKLSSTAAQGKLSYQAGLLKAEPTRMAASGTIKGKNGAKSGTDGAAIGEMNFRDADRLVQKLVQSGEDLSLSRLRQLNAIVGRGLKNNGGKPGDLRKMELTSGGSAEKAYIPSKTVDLALKDFMVWYNGAKKTLNPIELAARTYERLVTIHAFPDGNGRTSRMAMDWVLQRNGLPPASLTGDEVLLGLFGGKTVNPPPAERATLAVTNGVERTLKQMGGKSTAR